MSTTSPSSAALRCILTASLALLTALAGPTGAAATLTISCGAVGQELQLCKEGAEAWSRQSGHQVYLISTPDSTTERLRLYQKILGAGAVDIDVIQIDVIWPGLLARHLLDLKPYVGGRPEEHFAAIVENNTVDGRLVAMPWYTDAGVLYYRRDLLSRYGAAVPITWEALAAIAGRIQEAERRGGNTGMWGFVWQGDAYEGLTCDALEWVVSHGGGRLIEADGTVSTHNPRAAAALETAAGWIGQISPPEVLDYKEEEARKHFQAGNAVFMRNWPYAWALLNAPDSPVRGRVGVASLPRGGEDGVHASVLGGWNLAVSRYSRHPRLAADLVLYLSSRAEQKRRAIAGSYNPTIAELYEDPDVLAAVPFFGELYDVFTRAVPRPSSVTGARYDVVSTAFWEAVRAVLEGEVDAGESLARLARQLERMRGAEGW